MSPWWVNTAFSSTPTTSAAQTRDNDGLMRWFNVRKHNNSYIDAAARPIYWLSLLRMADENTTRPAIVGPLPIVGYIYGDYTVGLSRHLLSVNKTT